jgi:hypothetical protein
MMIGRALVWCVMIAAGPAFSGSGSLGCHCCNKTCSPGC